MAKALKLAVSNDDWLNWRWQLRHMLTDEHDFAKQVALTSDEKQALRETKSLFRVGATPYYASLMDPARADCPIRRQILPLPQEANIRADEMVDPLGEDERLAAPCVVHKYPDRVLLLVFDRCAIYCRHCNRRRMVGGDSPPAKSEIDAGIDYIAKTPRIRDVLLSGGDPLLLSTRRLENILKRLRAIDHVDFIRIGTRVPVVCPMRIDDELCQMLSQYHPLYINTHFNHAKELTQLAESACRKLVDAGIPLGNQTVLLRGINTSVQSLRALFRGLLRNRVKPYYLFQGDTVIGTDHLRTRVETAVELMSQLRGYMTGMAIPHLAIDLPGGRGKVPFGPQYLVETTDEVAKVKTYRGDIVEYPQPAEADAHVSYDECFFANTQPDDDSPGTKR